MSAQPTKLAIAGAGRAVPVSAAQADNIARRSLLRRVLAGAIQPLTRRAARAYIAGDTLEQALAVQTALAAARRYATLSYWSDAKDNPVEVANHYRATLGALAGNRLAGACSVKLPALAFRPDLLEQLAATARDTGVALHCDSLSAEDADRTRAAIERWQAQGVTAGTTLPGRWRRSIDDAHWAVEKRLPARVVKGQWPDPDEPNRDMFAGYLEVIDVLAGRATSVAVATHDVELAIRAIERLRRQGTPATWELLYGLPMQDSLAMAKTLGIDVRVYVPFGRSYLPYALRRLVRQPRMAMWLIKDLLAGGSADGR